MWRTLGNWTFAFTDYRDMNITLYLNDGSDNLDVLAAQLDPLNYAENLTMSKLVVDSTGDEFFQVRPSYRRPTPLTTPSWLRSSRARPPRVAFRCCAT